MIPAMRTAPVKANTSGRYIEHDGRWFYGDDLPPAGTEVDVGESDDRLFVEWLDGTGRLCSCMAEEARG